MLDLNLFMAAVFLFLKSVSVDCETYVTESFPESVSD